MRRSALKSRPARTGPSSTVVDMVLERAQYSCEACGSGVGDRRGVDYSIHHRRARAMGGSSDYTTNLPSNLMLLCGSATTGCHGFVESNRSAAVAAGWLVLSRTDPRKVPVLVEHGSRWAYLTSDGRYSDTPDGE